MSVTLKDIAREAAVSEGTVSLALNNRAGVSEETRRHVVKIADKYGYRPSVNAQNLSQKRSNLIGLLIPNTKNLFYSHIVQEIENELRNRGYKMLFATTANDERYEQEMVEQFVSFRVEGVILYPIIKNNHNPAYLEILRKNDIPLVFVGGYYRNMDAPYCMSDLWEAVSALVEHIHSGGRRKFFYFGACKTIVSNQIKMQAIEDTLCRLGGGHSDYIELKTTDFPSAKEAAAQMLAAGVSFDAAITGDAYSAFGVYCALRDAGLQVPKDVAIAHMDNLIRPDICVLPMTCIEQDVRGIVLSTLDILQSRMEGREQPPNALIPARLIVRKST